jgi:hypothetical protein
MTRVEDVDPAEAQRRVDAWLAESAEPAEPSGAESSGADGAGTTS